MQIPQQDRRAGPSSHRTNRPADTRIQVVLECINIAGIESMHMIRNGQMDGTDGKTMSAANQFYSLAA
jgi:hypothetical protein